MAAATPPAVRSRSVSRVPPDSGKVGQPCRGGRQGATCACGAQHSNQSELVCGTVFQSATLPLTDQSTAQLPATDAHPHVAVLRHRNCAPNRRVLPAGGPWRRDHLQPAAAVHLHRKAGKARGMRSSGVRGCGKRKRNAAHNRAAAGGRGACQGGWR